MTHDQTDRVLLERFQPLQLITNTPKGRYILTLPHQSPTKPPPGRGVFTARPIPSGTTIDISPVLILSPRENKEHIEKTSLYHYTYNWPCSTAPSGQPTTTQAVVLGLGSLFNHSRHDQNVGWRRDLAREVIVYRALRDIRAGEELCISYGDHLTFVDADASQLDAETRHESGEEMLGRIDLDGSWR